MSQTRTCVPHKNEAHQVHRDHKQQEDERVDHQNNKRVSFEKELMCVQTVRAGGPADFEGNVLTQRDVSQAHHSEVKRQG